MSYFNRINVFKFSKDQPRVPKGSPQGGQWASGGKGGYTPDHALAEGIRAAQSGDKTGLPGKEFINRMRDMGMKNTVDASSFLSAWHSGYRQAKEIRGRSTRDLERGLERMEGRDDDMTKQVRTLYTDELWRRLGGRPD